MEWLVFKANKLQHVRFYQYGMLATFKRTEAVVFNTAREEKEQILNPKRVTSLITFCFFKIKAVKIFIKQLQMYRKIEFCDILEMLL